MKRLASPALLLLLSCAFEPQMGEPFSPPPEYRAIWDSAQACTGRTGDFDELRFFVVPGDGFECSSGLCAGNHRDGTITLAGDFMDDTWVVKHEMIHALGFKEHTTIPFKTPCRATWDSKP